MTTGLGRDLFVPSSMVPFLFKKKIDLLLILRDKIGNVFLPHDIIENYKALPCQDFTVEKCEGLGGF